MVCNRPWLHKKDLCRRYSICTRTLERWLRRKMVPEPRRFTGPLWTLADLEAAERAGLLPAPAQQPERPLSP